MAFKEVMDLSCDVTISLGGTNKKTGKPNPTKIEGYYLGRREVEDRKKKSGKSYIYAFQTQKGKVGVWGKTDLDRKLQSVTPGCMVRATQNRMIPTPNGDMYGYKVEVDAENTIEVNVQQDSPQSEPEDNYTSYASEDSDDADLFDDETTLDEVPYTRAAKPAVPASTPDASAVSKAEALLSGKRIRV